MVDALCIDFNCGPKGFPRNGPDASEALMRRKVLGRITAPVRRYARLIAFLAPLALALAAVSVHAQQIPGVSPEQLMQLKQQFGQGG
jgi:hypothetical protein